MVRMKKKKSIIICCTFICCTFIILFDFIFENVFLKYYTSSSFWINNEEGYNKNNNHYYEDKKLLNCFYKENEEIMFELYTTEHNYFDLTTYDEAPPPQKDGFFLFEKNGKLTYFTGHIFNKTGSWSVEELDYIHNLDNRGQGGYTLNALNCKHNFIYLNLVERFLLYCQLLLIHSIPNDTTKIVRYSCDYDYEDMLYFNHKLYSIFTVKDKNEFLYILQRILRIYLMLIVYIHTHILIVLIFVIIAILSIVIIKKKEQHNKVLSD